MAGQADALMIIRPATGSDRWVIHRTVLTAGLNPTGLDWRRFLVAEQAGRIVGVVQVKPHSDGSCELASLAVVSAWRGKSVGSALIRALLARESGMLHLMCRAELQGYYARFGFLSLQPDAMPPYFRRIARLANLFSPPNAPRLAIMRRGARPVTHEPPAPHPRA